MNVLLATLVFPYPVNDGGKSGTYRMIESLRENNQVTLICPESKEEHHTALQNLWPDIKIITFKKSNAPAKDNFLVNLIKTISGRKYTPTREEVMKQQMLLTTCNLIEYYFENLLQLFRDELGSKKYDLVQIDFIELAPLVHYVPENTPTVFVHHEIRFKRMERELATLSDPDPSFSWKIANSKILELNLINRFDKVVALTDIDREILIAEGINPAKVETSPLPMVVNKHDINQPFVSENRILFLGPDQHYPNLDGLDWFLKNCWNQIRQTSPGIKLSVVGKWSSEKREWFKDYPDVIFEGFVPDLATVMEGAVMIVPLRIGSGMRMKILEGVSYRVPIISTTIGAEGLPMENDVNCKIADHPEEFSKAIIEVLKSPQLQNDFIEKALEILNSGYSTQECGARREEVYAMLLEDN